MPFGRGSSRCRPLEVEASFCALIETQKEIAAAEKSKILKNILNIKFELRCFRDNRFGRYAGYRFDELCQKFVFSSSVALQRRPFRE